MDAPPRLSGRSSPGGGSSLGKTSSALGAPGGATSSSARGTASSPSSGSGMTEAVPLVLLLSSQKASITTTAMARTPIPIPTALPFVPLPRPVLDGPNRRRTFPRASMACPTASLRLVLVLLRPKRSHMLLAPPSLRLFHYRPALWPVLAVAVVRLDGALEVSTGHTHIGIELRRVQHLLSVLGDRHPVLAHVATNLFYRDQKVLLA